MWESNKVSMPQHQGCCVGWNDKRTSAVWSITDLTAFLRNLNVKSLISVYFGTWKSLLIFPDKPNLQHEISDACLLGLRTSAPQNIDVNHRNMRLHYITYIKWRFGTQNVVRRIFTSVISSTSRLKSGNASYNSVQKISSSSLLSKNFNIKIHRTIILPFVLYGRETWSLTLREERMMTVFENRVLRTTFGPKRDEVTGEWRKLHNEELNDLYCSPNIIRVIKSRMTWPGDIQRMGEKRI